MGGGAIRIVAKAAMLGLCRLNVARGTPNLSISAPVSSIVHMLYDGETSPLVLSDKIEDRVMDPPPRLIFGPIPSFEEAKEATKDLKGAIDGLNFTNLENSKTGSQISDSGSTTLVALMSKRVVQAFSLLQRCTKGQVMSVAASLACDPKVWNAVLENSEFKSFISEHQSVTLPNEEATKPSMFAYMFQNIKVKVSAVVSNALDGLNDFMKRWTDGTQGAPGTKSDKGFFFDNISDILNDFMGLRTDSTQGAPGTKSDEDFFGESTYGASFMTLAVAVILVVLMKRG